MNPSIEELKESELDLVVAGTKEAVLMVESETSGLSEKVMLDAVKFGHEKFVPIIEAIEKLAKKAGKPKWEIEEIDHSDVKKKIASEVMDDSLAEISDYVNLANKNILDYQNKHSEATGMGTTMTIVEIDQEKVLHLAHVGDSRCYVLNNRNLIQLTKDENVPGYQNVLTQALGSKEKLKIQTKDFQLTSGDVVFLCTDGVYNEIGDEYLKNKLMDGVTAESLISEVLLQNPKDNISAIIINVI